MDNVSPACETTCMYSPKKNEFGGPENENVECVIISTPSATHLMGLS
jgi:hypothetical protein